MNKNEFEQAIPPIIVHKVYGFSQLTLFEDQSDVCAGYKSAEGYNSYGTCAENWYTLFTELEEKLKKDGYIFNS